MQTGIAMMDGFRFGLWLQVRATYMAIMLAAFADALASIIDFYLFTATAKAESDRFVEAVKSSSAVGEESMWCVQVTAEELPWPGGAACEVVASGSRSIASCSLPLVVAVAMLIVLCRRT